MKQEIAPVALWQDPQGNWIYDFGVNVAAIPLLTVEQPAGTRIKMRMGETLAADQVDRIQHDRRSRDRRRTDRRIRLHRKRQGKMDAPVHVPWIPLPRTIGRGDPTRKRLAESGGRTHRRRTDRYVRMRRPAKSIACTNGRPDDVEQHHGLPTDCPHRERCGWLGDAMR